MNKLKEKILNHLTSGEETKARAVLLTQLDADRFRENMTAAHNKDTLLEIDGLFEPDIAIDTISSQNNWNIAYWTKMNVELSNNFSKEKLCHIIDIMHYLREKRDEKFIPKQNNRSTLANKSNQNKANNSLGQRTEIIKSKGFIEVGLSTAAGAVIGAGLANGGVISGSVLKGAVIGGVVGMAIGSAVIYVIHTKKVSTNEK